MATQTKLPGSGATWRKVTRFLIYFFAAVIPPAMVAVIFTLSVAMDLMIQHPPEPLPESARAAVLDATATTAAAPDDPPAEGERASAEAEEQLNALFLIGNEGTQITDLLGTYEALGASRAFRLVTTARERRLSPLTGSLAVLPDTAFGAAPQDPDLLVLPAVLDITNREVIDWVRQVAKNARMVLVAGEGARIAAAAGLLDGRTATAHALAIEELERKYPQINLVADRRYVIDGNLITSAGLTAGVDAALEAIALLRSERLADQTARRLQYERHPPETRVFRGFNVEDGYRLFLRGGFDWFRRSVGVFLYEGVSELGLAAALDTYPRTLGSRTVTLAEKRRLIRTRNGLTVAPNVDMYHAPRLAQLVIPSQHGRKLDGESPLPLSRPTVHRWIEEYQSEDMIRSDFSVTPSGVAFSRSLDELSRREGSGVAKLVARLLEYPWEPVHSRNDWPPPGLLIRPLLIMAAGLLLARLLDMRIRTLRRQRREQREQAAPRVQNQAPSKV